jgi:antitoxin HicB
MAKRNKHIGSSLDDFLKEEGVLEETRAIALKDAVALDRLLTPGNASVTLQTLARAARAIGRDLRIELV